MPDDVLIVCGIRHIVFDAVLEVWHQAHCT